MTKREEVEQLCQAALRLLGGAGIAASIEIARLRELIEQLKTVADERVIAKSLATLLDAFLARGGHGVSSQDRALGRVQSEAWSIGRGRRLARRLGERPPTRERAGINAFMKELIAIPTRPGRRARAPRDLDKILPDSLVWEVGDATARPRAKATKKTRRPSKKAGVKRGAKRRIKRFAKRTPLRKRKAAPKKARRKARVAAATPAPARSAQKPKRVTRAPRSAARDWSPVFLGVSAPRAVRRGESFTARFAAYIKKLEEEVTRKLKAMADVEAAVGFSPQDETHWKKGTRVTVRATGQHFSADPPESWFKWNGRDNIAQFQVTTKAGAPLGKTQLRFEASIAGVRVASISIDVTIGSRTAARPSSATSAPYGKAFASYARRDTKRVTDHLSGFKARVRGTKIFMDCLDLVRGEDWKSQLKKEISESEVFLLFWSKAAAKSKWVTWEWRHAHGERKELQAFRLDHPKPELPKPLAALHADDEFQLVRRAHAK